MNNLSSTTRFFIKTGGYDPAAAAQCTPDERLRMEQRGSLVFVPTFVALLGMCTSVWTVSNNYFIALIVGTIWALIIFKIDTALMSGTASLLSFTGLGRIAFAISASFIVAECIVMVVFKDTIDEKNQSVFQAFVDKANADFDSIKSIEYNKLLLSQQDRDQKFRVFREEIDGSGGSGYEGWDKIGDAKYTNFLSAAKAYGSDSITYLNATKALDIIRSQKISEFKAARANDIAGKLKTLSEIENPYVHIAVWFLRLLLLLAELMPLFLKYQPSKPSDVYGKIVELQAKNIMLNLQLETKLHNEVMAEKAKLTEAKAKVQANYDNNIEEMDMYHDYMSKMSHRYDRYTFDAEDKIIGDDKSGVIKNIKDKIDNMWHKITSRMAS